MASASVLFVAVPPPTKPLAGAGLIRRPKWRIPEAADRGEGVGGGEGDGNGGGDCGGGGGGGCGDDAGGRDEAIVGPKVAEAVQAGIPPSLKNFLLSIVAGGIVLGVIVGVVIAVANFDPVKRT